MHRVGIASGRVRGGVITFSCGAAPVTIKLASVLVARADTDTVIDGGNLVTLDGQGATQILRAEGNNFRTNDHVLAVQRIALVNGRDVGTGYVARQGTSVCAWGYKDGGGGAIFTNDMNLRVWGASFTGNRGPDTGPDVAGGAIYTVGSKTLTVVGSRFVDNAASNGGAIGALQVATTLVNTTFDGNHATGQLANFADAKAPDNSPCPTFNHVGQGGSGGLGGAFYSDGFGTDDSFLSVRMSGNGSNDLGGAVFRSAYWGLDAQFGKQTFTGDTVVMDHNTSAQGGGGAAYVNNSAFVLRHSKFDANDSGTGDGGGLKITGATVNVSDTAFTNNKSAWGGGVAMWGGGPDGFGTVAGLSYSGNQPNDAVGDFPK